MSSVMVDALVLGWDKNLDYVKRLVAEIPADRMVYQPAANVNHPAWILSHLNIYHVPMAGMLRGTPFEDPKNHKFGMTSKPQSDASVYLSKAQLLADFERGHEDVKQALLTAGQAGLEAATPLERWRGPYPKVGIILNYLMILHESTHIGQLSAWRRV